jgi:hypothetical protein
MKIFITAMYIISIYCAYSQNDLVDIKASCSLSNDSLKIKISISNGLKEKIFFPISSWQFKVIDTIPIEASGSLIGVNQIYVYPSNFKVDVATDTIFVSSFGDSIPYFRCIDAGTVIDLNFTINAANCLNSNKIKNRNIFINLAFSRENDFLNLLKNYHYKKRNVLIKKNSFNLMDSPGLIRESNLCWEFKNYKYSRYYVGCGSLNYESYFNLRKAIVIKFDSIK